MGKWCKWLKLTFHPLTPLARVLAYYFYFAKPIYTVRNTDPEEEKHNFTPLIVILLYLFGGVVLTSIISNNFSPHTMMINFMGGFFVLFSLFKMINIAGFADAFATYDVLASRSRLYGLTYPFIELALGIAYITRYLTNTIHIITLILMLIGSVGVYKALKTNRQFQCACLGTSLKLPMTKITLIEDLIMGLMAFAMLVI